MNSAYSRSDILQGLLDTLQNMLNSARNDDWDEVANYNKLRLNLSAQLQTTPRQQEQNERHVIDKLCEIDLEVLELAKKSRDAAANDMHDMNGRKSNVNQYLQNQFS